MKKITTLKELIGGQLPVNFAYLLSEDEVNKLRLDGKRFELFYRKLYKLVPNSVYNDIMSKIENKTIEEIEDELDTISKEVSDRDRVTKMEGCHG